MEPRWHQNLAKLGHGFDTCFLKDVGSIFIDFLSQLNIAYIAKILIFHLFFLCFLLHRHNSVVTLMGWFFNRFFLDFLMILGSKINEKSIKNQWKKWSMTRWMLGWILDGSWTDFGWILGGFWEPSWAQNPSKIVEKVIWKVDWQFDRKNGGVDRLQAK